MLWKVETQGDAIVIGGRSRPKLNPRGCNQPFKNVFWCPRRSWFRNEPCPFVNRRECNNYAMMCGAL